MMPAWRNQAPEPGEGRRQQVEQANDAVGGRFARAGWGAHAKGADIDRDWLVDDIRNDVARKHPRGLGQGFPG